MTDLSAAGGTRVLPPGMPSLPDVSLGQLVEAEIQKGDIELPVLPEVAVRVRELVAHEGDIADIVTVIEQEPAFAAAVLRYANSVAYAGLREIVDLRQAVTRLGLQAVEQTILSIAARNAFRSDQPEDERLFRSLWDHSIVTALAARRLASRVSGVGPELAFLGGLLHDFGKVLILHCAASLRKRLGHPSGLSETALLEFFDSLHCKVGDNLFNKWNLPVEIRDVARRHHDEKFVDPQDRLIATVAFADGVAAKLGASLRPDPSLSLLDRPAASLVRIDDVRLASLLVDLEDDILRVREAL